MMIIMTAMIRRVKNTPTAIPAPLEVPGSMYIIVGDQITSEHDKGVRYNMPKMLLSTHKRIQLLAYNTACTII